MKELRLSTVRRWIEEATDHEFYDRLYTLNLFMSGEKEAIAAAMEGRALKRSKAEGDGKELADYAEILPALGMTGVQNHGLVNARINVQGLSMEPDFTFQHPDPLVRQVNAAWLTDRWQTQRWDEEFYIGGMEVEANGFAGFHCGVDNDRVNWRHYSNLDTLFDRSRKSPSRWQWVAVRDRLTPEEVEDLYGDALDKKDIQNLTTKEVTRHNATKLTRIDQVVEWCFYTADHHFVFLGSIHGANCVVLKTDSGNRYRKARGDDPVAGPNPFGVIPHAWWVDSWAPGVRRPVSKFETTHRLTSMLNEVELYMVECLRNGVPVTAINTENMLDPDIIKEIHSAKSWKALQKVLAFNGDVREVLNRTPAMDLPQVAMVLRSTLKEEINASTGVADMQRGQSLSGDRRTREEVRTFADMSGIQARHFKRGFARLIEDVVSVSRAIGAQYDTGRTVLMLQDFEPIDTDIMPAQPFLLEYLPCRVSPDSLSYKTEEERRQEAMDEFNLLIMPGIQLGVVDPVKGWERIARKWGGYRDPLREVGIQQSMMAPQMPGMPPGAPGATPEVPGVPPGMPPIG